MLDRGAMTFFAMSRRIDSIFIGYTAKSPPLQDLEPPYKSCVSMKKLFRTEGLYTEIADIIYRSTL